MKPEIRAERALRSYMNPDVEWNFPSIDKIESRPSFSLFIEIHKGRAVTPSIAADWEGGLLKVTFHLFNVFVGFYWMYDLVAWEWSREQADMDTICLLTEPCEHCGHTDEE